MALGPEAFPASPTSHEPVFGVHAYLPTSAHKETVEKSDKCFQVHKKKKKKSETKIKQKNMKLVAFHSLMIPLHLPTQYKLHILKKAFSSWVGLPHGEGRPRPWKHWGESRLVLPLRVPMHFRAASKASPSRDRLQFLAGIVSGFSEPAAVVFYR